MIIEMTFFFVMRGFFGLALIVASAAAQSGDCKTCTRFMTSLQENFDSETAFTTVQDSFRSTLCSALPDESMVKTVSMTTLPTRVLPPAAVDPQ